MPTARKPRLKTGENKQADYIQDPLFGTDYVSLYGLEMNVDVRPSHDIPLDMIISEKELVMRDKVHTQMVAIKGWHEMNKFANACIGDVGTDTASKATTLLENIEQMESTSWVSRRKKQLEEVNSRVAGHTSGMMLQANATLGRTILEGCRQSIYVEPSEPPAPPKRKGFFPTLGEILFGERE